MAQAKQIKSILMNKWVLMAAALVLAFLIYHAPRLASALPIS